MVREKEERTIKSEDFQVILCMFTAWTDGPANTRKIFFFDVMAVQSYSQIT